MCRKVCYLSIASAYIGIARANALNVENPFVSSYHFVLKHSRNKIVTLKDQKGMLFPKLTLISPLKPK